MDTHQAVKVSSSGPVLRVTLNRPESHNALNKIMIEELTRIFQELASSHNFRVVILGGNGRTFCSGADLSMMRAAATQTESENRAGAEKIFDLMLAVYECPIPVIGKISGPAFGGGVGLVACCDIAISVERAKFAFSEVRLGIVPAVISPFILDKIPVAQAIELFITGERFSANRALDIGLLHKIVADADIDAAVEERVQVLLQAAPAAQVAAKKLIREVKKSSISDLRSYTSELIAQIRTGDEGREGMSAFLERRKPSWLDPTSH